MIPFADFTYFGLLLYVVLPTIVLGWFGRAGWRWALAVTVALLAVQYHGRLAIHGQFALREIWIVLGYAAWQWLLVTSFARWKKRGAGQWPGYLAITASLLPLALAKFLPLISPDSQFGFLGISYVTFRALDVVFSVQDKVLAAPRALELFGFLFFFPTISSGPIDRFRRFAGDWKKQRTRAEFLADLDGATQRLFRGFFYKFILAALIKQYWLNRAANGTNLGSLASYMYAYSFYLFFDFAGYSAFAISLSYLFGIHTPENFHQPFLARNIRDFWNRWHITLSFWFRDHVYMRFVLAATRGKFFAGKHTAGLCGYFLSFGLMGVWHGLEPHFIVYGLYHATLLAGYDLFARWNKIARWWGDGPVWRAANVFLTFQFVCCGLLIFSGHFSGAKKAHHSSELPAPAR